MEYTDRYVYVDKFTSVIIGNTLIANLDNPGGRTPYCLVEVISCIASNTTEYEGIIVTTTNLASNFFSSRNRGTVLCINGKVLSQGGTNHHYNLIGAGTKAVLYGSLRQVVLTFTRSNGDDILIDDLDTLAILIKCSYPRQDEITNTFSKQIPLPSRV
jgi:hypothetical protein